MSPLEGHVRRDGRVAQGRRRRLFSCQKERRRCRVAPPPFVSSGSLLGGLEIDGRRAAALGGDLVVDLLAFIQAVQARTLDGADVHEHVLAAVGWLDETETL